MLIAVADSLLDVLARLVEFHLLMVRRREIGPGARGVVLETEIDGEVQALEQHLLALRVMHAHARGSDAVQRVDKDLLLAERSRERDRLAAPKLGACAVVREHATLRLDAVREGELATRRLPFQHGDGFVGGSPRIRRAATHPVHA